MSLESEVQTLLKLKTTLEQTETAYEAQRRTVRDAMVQAGLTAVEQDGYRIARSEDRTVRTFDLDLLREQLTANGLSESSIDELITRSRSESAQRGILRITPLK